VSSQVASKNRKYVLLLNPSFAPVTCPILRERPRAADGVRGEGVKEGKQVHAFCVFEDFGEASGEGAGEGGCGGGFGCLAGINE
jgi:hypothetical protein